MGGDEGLLDGAHRAYERQAWREAHDRFAAADAQRALAPDDVERYARTAALLGNDDRYVELLGRASRAWATGSDLARAAECACQLAVNLLLRGDWGPATGWLRRAQQQVDEVGAECASHSWLLGLEAVQVLRSGDAASAYPMFERARAIGRRCADPDSTAITSMGAGQSLIAMGRFDEGMRCLDELMVSVIGGELNPVFAGVIYCGVIAACQEGYDARRAGEWTLALSRWCDAQPDLVPFRGPCLVHRAQIMQLRGSWSDAADEITRACEALSKPPGHPAEGMAHYERAELLRLRGDLAQAEQAYGSAARFGHETQPGWALLRLAQGRLDQARAGLARALGEANESQRPVLLAAAVQVALATDDIALARAHAAELTDIAGRHGALLLDAMAGHAAGATLVAEGHPAQALGKLRAAWRAWQELEAPYPAARVRVLVGRACRDLGDLDAARMEFDAAAAVFERLGARPDLRDLHRPATAQDRPAGLTGREMEVLRQVAAGKTNRAIATELFLSEKTVARHISNIFAKLGVGSRSAATAYAYEQHLV